MTIHWIAAGDLRRFPGRLRSSLVSPRCQSAPMADREPQWARPHPHHEARRCADQGRANL